MDFFNNFYGRNPTIRCRAPVVGTTELNVYPVAQNIKWNIVFNAAYALDLSSSSAADAAAGTGARTVEIYGLDVDFNPQSETVTLNGQTIITSTKAFRRVFAAVVQTYGSGGQNAGDVYIYKTGTGGTLTAGVPGTLTGVALKMLVGDNIALNGLFTAPRGQNYRIAMLAVNARAQAGTLFCKHGKPIATSGVGPFSELKLEFGAGTSVVDLNFEPDQSPFLINEREDIYFTAICAAAGGIVNVTAKLAQTNS